MPRSATLALRTLLAALCLAAAGAQAATLPPDALRDIARRIDDLGGAAFAQHDYDKYVRETFPGIVEMSGGRDKMIEQMKASFAMMDAQHVKFVSHVSTPESQTTDAGKYEVLRVPEESVLEAGGHRVKGISYTLAVRSKPAGEWTFIGGSGLVKQPQLLWQLLPGLPRDYKLPPSSMQPI